jgi:hypothetical protein
VTNPHSYKVTGWGTEFAFYRDVTEEQAADGFDDLDADEHETLVGTVEVVSGAETVHTSDFDYEPVEFGGGGLVRPLHLKWGWDLELAAEFDPKLLSFDKSRLVYDGVEYEPDWQDTKGEDEAYPV